LPLNSPVAHRGHWSAACLAGFCLPEVGGVMDSLNEAQPLFHAGSLPGALSHASPNSWRILTASEALK